MSLPAGSIASDPADDRIATLRSLAVRGLERMYDAERELFVFRVRRGNSRVVHEGFSHRYTAISLIGLAAENGDVSRRVLGGRAVGEAADRLVARTGDGMNLGDLALTAWAARVCGAPTARIWEHVAALQPDVRTHPTVELAWTLSALAVDDSARVGPLRERLAERLRRAFVPEASLFPHVVGDSAARRPRHVTCFADFVYPTLALAQYGALTDDRAAVACATRSAVAMCEKQGAAGQWWWHYDCRTGDVVERYPVYAVHQDAMAPMALLAVADVARASFDGPIARGLDWLWSAPELAGRSLIDGRNGLIWRKVARREPAKLSRYVQATASRVSPRLRVPAIDSLFPPTAVDYEDRPYHLGWVLYAWRERSGRASGSRPA